MKNRRRSAILLLFMIALINVPLVHSTWVQRQIANDGVNVFATVTDDFVISPDEDEPRYIVEFQFDEEVDSEQRFWSAPVNEATHEAAVREKRITVRVLPDDPGAYAVEGEQTSRIGLVLALLADLVLLSLAVLIIRSPSIIPARADLHLVATDDLTRCKPGASVKHLGEETYVVCGDICAITDDSVVIDAGDRLVHVQMGHFSNPVGYQQPAQATGRSVAEPRS